MASRRDDREKQLTDTHASNTADGWQQIEHILDRLAAANLERQERLSALAEAVGWDTNILKADTILASESSLIEEIRLKLRLAKRGTAFVISQIDKRFGDK